MYYESYYHISIVDILLQSSKGITIYIFYYKIRMLDLSEQVLSFRTRRIQTRSTWTNTERNILVEKLTFKLIKW